MKILRKWGKGRRTMWEVQGMSGEYTVMVDSDGVWHCSCPSSTYRGHCSHIWGIRIFREWHNMFPKVEAVMPTPMSERVFLKLMELPRFILHYKYPGRRHLIAFGLRIYVDGGGPAKLMTKTSSQLNGTVIEVVSDEMGTYYAWDCLWFKGEDIRQRPLCDRLIKAAEAVGVWGCPFIEEAPIIIDHPEKLEAHRVGQGKVILKDIGAAYINRPRTWLERR